MSRPSKQASKKAGRVVRRQLADGSVKEYRYKAYRAPKSESPRLERDSVATLVRSFKASPEWRELAPKTVETYAFYIMPLDNLGHHKVSEVTRRHILEIRDAIAQERGNGAANAFLRSSSVLFSWAVNHDWISHSPVYKVAQLKAGALPAWTAADAITALAGLPEHYRRVVVLGVYTGQRRGDLIAARWADYDGARLTVTQQKTGAVVVLTCNPALKGELDAWKGDASENDTILVSKSGNPWIAKSLTTNFPRRLQALGMDKGLNVHGMRKLFAAGMASEGATTHEIASYTGHKTLSMVQHYTVTADQRKLSEGSVNKIQLFATPAKPIEKV